MGLFGLGKMTNKVGKAKLTNAYYLQFLDLDGRPTRSLEDSLAIGSEVGDFIAKNEGISPRHCTFYLNQDVVSVMDHDSLEGTFIGKKQIAPGRMIILQAKDKVYIGKHQVKIIAEKIAIADNSELESLEPTGNIDTEIVSKLPTETKTAPESEEPAPHIEEKAVSVPVPVPVEEESPTEKDKQKEPSKPKVQYKNSGFTKAFKLKVKQNWGSASNPFIRFVGLVFDCICVAILLTLLSPMEDLLSEIDHLIPLVASAFVDLIKMIQDLAGLDIVKEVSSLVAASGILKSIWADIVAAFANPEFKSAIRFLTLFAIFRLITALIFGVSFGCFMVAMKANGNFITARIKGVLREFIGLFTGPFLIFDVPTLFNRRSFKELLSFSLVETRSASSAWVLGLFSGLFLLSLLVLAPFFKGFKLMETMKIASNIALEDFKEKEEQLRRYANDSHYFGVSMVDGFGENLIPTFLVLKNKNKTTAHISLNLTLGDKVVSFKPYRNVKWDVLLKEALTLNPLGKMKFPTLDGMVYGAGNKNPNFKVNMENYKAYAGEVFGLTSSALDLQLFNLFNYLKVYGPYLTPILNYRESFIGLVPAGSELQMMTNVADGSAFLMKLNDNTFYIIPITFPKGKILEVKISGKLTDKDLKMLLGSLFFNPKSKTKLSKLKNGNVLSFVDTIYLGLLGKEKPELLQSSYEWLFNNIKRDMADGNLEQLKLWEKSLKGMVKLIESQRLDKNPKMPAWQKFFQHTNDLLKAIRDKDSKFFGLEKGKLA